MASKEYSWNKKKTSLAEGMYWDPNPGMWSEAVFYLNKTGPKPDFANLFTYMSNIIADDRGMEYAIQNYKKMINVIPILPGYKFFTEKLRPALRGAISNFIVRNYVGTIALSGMVSEMMIDFLFDVWNEVVRENPLSTTSQKKLFGREFENLALDRCINILFEYNIINLDEKSDFEYIKNKRNNYVHLYSTDLKNIEKDALEVFQKTNKILEKTIGMEISNRKILMNSHIVKYLKNHE